LNLKLRFSLGGRSSRILGKPDFNLKIRGGKKNDSSNS